MNLKNLAAFPSKYRFLLLVAAVLFVAGAGIGLAGSVSAQTPTPTPAPSGKVREPLFGYDQFLGKLAGRLSIDAQRLREAIVGSQKDLVQEAVQAGRLTQAQADQLNQQIDASGGQPFFGMHGKPGLRGRGPVQAGPRLSQDLTLQAAATYIGISVADLHAAIRQGKSLAQVASEDGKTRDGLRAALIQDVENRTNQAVKDGKITEQQAGELRQQFSTQVDQLLDRTSPARPARPAGRSGA